MEEIINYLIADELEAIKGYEESIKKINDPKVVSQLEFIKKQEQEHIYILKKIINQKSFKTFAKPR